MSNSDIDEYKLWCKQKEIVRNIVDSQWDYWLKKFGYDTNINVCELLDDIYKFICNNINEEVAPLFRFQGFPKERSGASIGWNYRENLK